MLGPIKSAVHAFGRWYCEEICRREYESQDRKINERPIEFRYVFEQIARLNPATVLDVGTGTTALPHLIRNCGCVVTAIDNVRDYWPSGMFNRHYYIRREDITRCTVKERFDLVTCISVLEHIPNHQAAVQTMLNLLNPGGHLIMTFPYNENTYVDDAFKRPGAERFKGLPYICQVYSRRELDLWASGNDTVLVDQEYWRCFEGTFWAIGDYLLPAVRASRAGPHDLTCILMQKAATNNVASGQARGPRVGDPGA